MSWPEAQIAPHWDRLSFELDGIDVTAMLERREGGAQLALPMPLSRGAHRLRVVYGAADGSLVEWADWTFHVAGEPIHRARADITLQLQQRLLNQGTLVADVPWNMQAEGAAKLHAQREAEDWTTTADAELWLNTRRPSSLHGNALDLGEYLLQADGGDVQWRLGHHQVPHESLIHADFQRRGLSFRMALPGASTFNGFAMRSEPTAGFRSFTGISEPQHRVGGMVFERQLLQSAGGGLSVSAALVSGQGNDLQGQNDPDLLSSTPLHKGTSWALGGEAQGWNRRLRLRAEVARSRYDWDPEGLLSPGSGTETDNAHALSLHLKSADEPGAAQWSLDLEHRDVGTFFRSVAHIGLASDKVMNRLRGAWRQGHWLAGMTLMRVDTNANGLADLPWIATDLADLQLTWSPPLTEQRPWYGHPTLGWNASRVVQVQRSTPLGFVGTPTHNRSGQIGLSLVLNHEGWNTQLGVSAGSYTDLAHPAASTRSTTLSWGGHWRLGEHWTLGPTVEWSRVREVDSQQRKTHQAAGLSTDFSIIPDRFLGNLNVGLNRSSRTLDSQRETHVYAVGELVWRLQKAAPNRAGWDVRLSFSHQDMEDILNASNTGKGHMVFLGLTMTLPASTRD